MDPGSHLIARSKVGGKRPDGGDFKFDSRSWCLGHGNSHRHSQAEQGRKRSHMFRILGPARKCSTKLLRSARVGSSMMIRFTLLTIVCAAFASAGQFGEKKIDKGLNLTPDQQTQVRAAYKESKTGRKGLAQQARGLRGQLQDAIHVNDSAKIDAVSKDLGQVQGEKQALRAKTNAKIYSV